MQTSKAVNDVDSTETYLSLYAGGGGLDMGFKRARPNAQCVAFVEHEASAAALLVDHVEAGLLDAAPLFTDAFAFPAERFHGLVDWIIGGPPCQPFSVAGRQLGADDARNLWPLTLRLVEQIQPGGCFFENVPSAESLWYVYENVIPGLRHLGYEVAAGIFSAAEVGAPHNRERIFILADAGREHGDVQQRGAKAEHPGSGGDVGHTGRGSRRAEQRLQPQGAGGWAGEPGEGVAHAVSERGRGRDGGGGYARDAFPPGPTGDWSNVPERLYPAVEPGFRDVADGLAGRVAALSRSQELRIAGNGVVPMTAERAFLTLRRQL
ncbi:MAG: DNA cytosine methyltransferase [Chloroflexi bacterium]|nr:DNA cytosine methyltransferase [Chloroflexota bacterium]